MASLSIGQVAKRTGLRTSALRYYDEAEYSHRLRY
jgi:DNA-binding transcriptional MerR regulator